MTIRYGQHFNTQQTPQSEPIPGEKQVQNNAGGYVYEVDKWTRLRRFLILGSDGGTYYVREKKLTRDNALCVQACLRDDPARAIKEICDISLAGRAPKNDPAIFALAIAASDQSPATRSKALSHLSDVCRIPTHLFHFLEFCKGLRHSSRMFRTAIAKWYQRYDADALAFQLVKYQQRDGWSHKDALRLSHAKLPAAHQAALRWAVGANLEPRFVARKNQGFAKEMNAGKGGVRYEAIDKLPEIIEAFEHAKEANEAELITLIHEYGLTREMVPTGMLNSAGVWDALLAKMPPEAMIRNLGKMSAVGLLVPMSDASRQVTKVLRDFDLLCKKRIHPMNVLNALRVYQSGHGEKGSLTWRAVPAVVDALDAAFYGTFRSVEPTGKRLLLALDVSGSMGSTIAGTGLTCREASAAMALVTANVETDYTIVGFTAESNRSYYRMEGAISPLDISPNRRLDDVVKYITGLNFGATDCALPMVYAAEQKMLIDAFCVYTDSETWAGRIHPKQALREYRRSFVDGAKEVVVGMTATEFSIADPADPNALDVVGFDLSTPQAIAEFIK